MTKLSSLDFVKLLVDKQRTFKFPVHTIRAELNMCFVSQQEFFYFIKEAYNKLKKKHGRTVAILFLQLVHDKFGEEIKAETLEIGEYMDKLEELILKLQRVSITRIPPEDPDYDVLIEIAKNP